MANEEKILAMLDKMQSDLDLIKKHIGANIFNRFDENLKVHAFDFLNNAKPAVIAKFIQDESAETIAIILTCLDTFFAARILDNLP